MKFLQKKLPDSASDKEIKIKKLFGYKFLFAIFISFALLWSKDENQLVSVKPLVKDSILCGIFLTILAIILIVIYLVYLGKSAKIQSTIKAILLASIMAFTIESLIILRNINIYFDDASVTFVNTIIYEKYYGKRHEVMKLYSNNKEKFYQTFVDKNTYQTAQVGDALCLEEMPGFIGYKWIKKVHLKKCIDVLQP